MRCVLRAVVLVLAAIATTTALSDAISCSTIANCPTVPCHTVSACSCGVCHYTQLAAKTLCPGQSCSNGRPCDDDAKDFCNANGKCVDAVKRAGTKCETPCFKNAKCDGESGMCPATKPSRAGTACTGSNNDGLCDAPDTCDGAGQCKDNYKPKGTLCQAGGGYSNKPSYYCTGTTGTCDSSSVVLAAGKAAPVYEERSGAFVVSAAYVAVGVAGLVVVAAVLVQQRRAPQTVLFVDDGYLPLVM
ncbi:hypothetical protein SPRG_14050 [Saprolegnia parasitica CBS 223.65]|uniref:Disintegrin domain-containing protein n=1 Tax=Saprolegnia parasitica (strain CBS 223.65) TaxID=695850 RepID=A0A067BRR8_SAPPC|nr:hypothetical protein SPRG_14050 [Saprolegnia parasitica CBS 223.65]KDO20958.1 hypothetical protein SPRG_14050 [Saprolegnia parasitica CBS 223.65]|eukprot:XP_012208348.1 hypothetical protein SPRG_14050 [Saprolegnia parasitica CBS 223.65]